MWPSCEEIELRGTDILENVIHHRSIYYFYYYIGFSRLSMTLR